MLIPGWGRGTGRDKVEIYIIQSLGQLSNMAVKSLFDSHNSPADVGRCCVGVY